jgi:hypothetical protein
MGYNPTGGMTFQAPGIIADRNKEMRAMMKEDMDRDKENMALLKGFKMLHQASPELQEMLPVEDWGAVSPNQVRGLMSATGMMTDMMRQKSEQAQMEAAQAEMERGERHRNAIKATVGATDTKDWLNRYVEAGGDDPTTIQGLMEEAMPRKPTFGTDEKTGANWMTTSDRSWVPLDTRKTRVGNPNVQPRTSADGKFWWKENDWEPMPAGQAGMSKLNAYQVEDLTKRKMAAERAIADLRQRKLYARENRLWPGESKGSPSWDAAITKQLDELAGIEAALNGQAPGDQTERIDQTKTAADTPETIKAAYEAGQIDQNEAVRRLKALR